MPPAWAGYRGLVISLEQGLGYDAGSAVAHVDGMMRHEYRVLPVAVLLCH